MLCVNMIYECTTIIMKNDASTHAAENENKPSVCRATCVLHWYKMTGCISLNPEH